MSVSNNRVLDYAEEHHVALPKHDIGEDNPIYVGFEIEYIDRETIIVRGKDWPLVYDNQVPYKIFDRLKEENLLDYAKSTLDSSVSGELVTAPFSIEYLVSEPGRDVLRSFERILDDSGAATDGANFLRWKHKWKSEKCNVGGHIHVSCKDPVVIAQIARLVGLTWKYWHGISGRPELSPWANFPFVGKYGEVNIGHTMAISSDDETVEFRFWGSTGLSLKLLDRALLCADLVRYISEGKVKQLVQGSDAYAESVLKDFLAKRKIF